MSVLVALLAALPQTPEETALLVATLAVPIVLVVGAVIIRERKWPKNPAFVAATITSW